MGGILWTREASVLTLELSNPGKANALDANMLAELGHQLERVNDDLSIRAVVIRGRAGGTFSSGADIAEWGPMTPEEFSEHWIGRGNDIFGRLEALRCPTVAVIEGLCWGGGLELALCADLRIATPNASFRFPEVTLGAIPGWQGGPRLARVVGRGRALEAVLLAQEIGAETAHGWGLVNVLAPVTELDGSVASVAARLTTISPCAATLAKASIVGCEEPDTFFPAAARTIKGSEDAAIGIRAFAAKTAALY